MSDQQLKSFLRRVLKGFSSRNYRITPRLWQPDFGWDHSGVPLAFSMTLTTIVGWPNKKADEAAQMVYAMKIHCRRFSAHYGVNCSSASSAKSPVVANVSCC